MKQKLTLLFGIFMLFVSMQTLKAEPPRKRGRGYGKAKARVVLLRTTRAIKYAKKSVKKGKVYSGHFRRAVLHQRLARRMYLAGKYRKAIAHSRYSRRLAAIAIKKNKGKVNSDFGESAEEKGMSDMPADSELDSELKTEVKDDGSEEDLLEEAELGIDID